MNREAVLTSIRQHLQENLVDTGEVRPLGELVPIVASSLRQGKLADKSVGIVPVDMVASFVDGTLDTVSERVVLDAIQADNSVLAEVIAAIRSMDDESAAKNELSSSLSDRLSQLVGTQFASQDTARDSDAELVPAQIVQGESAFDISEVRTPEVHALSPEGQPLPQLPSRIGSAWGTKVGGLVLAASILIVTYVGIRWVLSLQGAMESRGSQNVAQQPSESTAPDSAELATDDTEPSGPDIETNSNGQSIASVSGGDAHERDEGATRLEDKQVDPSLPAPDSTSLAVSPDHDKTQTSELDPLSPAATSPESPVTVQPNILSDLKWSEIHGLLTRRSTSPTSTSSSSSSQDAFSWSLIETGNAVFPSAESEERGLLSLRTLPMSKAVATLETGGRIVMAADSSLRLSRMSRGISASLDLQYGALALMDMPAGTTIRLRSGRQPPSDIRWETEASAILKRSQAGLEMHVSDGTIAFNGTAYEGSAIAIGSDQNIAPVGKMARLPKWINSDAGTIPAHVLGQLDTSGNLADSLLQKINSYNWDKLPTRQRAAATMFVQLHASLDERKLLRLATSDKPLLRKIAIARMFSIPNWDPRFQILWSTAEAMVRDKRRVTVLKNFVRLTQSGTRFTVPQIDEMLVGLEAPDAPSRVLYDFMLRRAFGGGPSFEFDPRWAPQNRARAVAAWRKYAGRPARSRPAAGNR